MRKEHELLALESGRHPSPTRRHPLRRQGIQTEPAPSSGSCAFAQDDGSGCKNLNTLIVEDNPIARIALKNILLRLDECADLAVTGEEAIEKIKIHQYRLILMDIGLPGKDGCEVTQIIRQWEKAHNLPPAYIVAQSSHLDEALEKKCLATGMNACYCKPLSTEIIANLINSVYCV